MIKPFYVAYVRFHFVISLLFRWACVRLNICWDPSFLLVVGLDFSGLVRFQAALGVCRFGGFEDKSLDLILWFDFEWWMHLFWLSRLAINLMSRCYLVFSNISYCFPMEFSSGDVGCFCSVMRLALDELVRALLSNLSQTYWCCRNLVSSRPAAPNTSSIPFSFQSLFTLFPFWFCCSLVFCVPPPSGLFYLWRPVLLFTWK